MATPPYGSRRTTAPAMLAVRRAKVPAANPSGAITAEHVDMSDVDYDGDDSPVSGRPTMIPNVDPASFDMPALDDPGIDIPVHEDVDTQAEEEHVDTLRAPPGVGDSVLNFALLRPKPVTCPPPGGLDDLDDSPLALAADRPTLMPPERLPTPVPATPPRAMPARDERLAVEMRDRYAVGDFSGALTAAEALLQIDSQHSEALKHAASCREVLCQMYTGRLGSLIHVPFVAISQDKVRWLSLDHRAGFLLACVDGFSTVEEILDVCGMPALDALRILTELHDQNVIGVGAR